MDFISVLGDKNTKLCSTPLPPCAFMRVWAIFFLLHYELRTFQKKKKKKKKENGQHFCYGSLRGYSSFLLYFFFFPLSAFATHVILILFNFNFNEKKAFQPPLHWKICIYESD
ncbi:unnamed protein product [Meganyctiphanes norvegica]|uniref:Transmembrane protein n=1 Tax=Meganyctiphanes norvegica TaxID=48144 RepID=A0AAV2RJP0_MEGNR